MELKPFGKTGHTVSRLGIGLSEIGQLSTDETARVADTINSALDAGVNFLDTSACYGNSEELVGRAVSDRRDEYFLATKAGHFLPRGEGEDWTAGLITESIDRSLERLRTDHVDLVQLHSCGKDILEKGDVIRALEDARDAGKTRFIGYSGDNENAEWAVKSGRFDTLQTSFSLVDQRARTTVLPEASSRGMGVIIKRPIGNAVWGMAQNTGAEPKITDYATEYFRRAQAMQTEGPLSGAPDDPILLAMGFTFAHSEVDVAIIGTANPAHMRSNIQLVSNDLPIGQEAVDALHERYERVSDGWEQRG